MTIPVVLTAQQKAWLDAQVERGDFASIEEAVRQLLGERIAERLIEEGDDLAWAKPDVDVGVSALERGDVITRQEHRSRNIARLAAIRS